MTLVRPLLLTRHGARHVLVTVLLVATVLASARIDAAPRVRAVAVGVHVIGLFIGLGAVLLVDWNGLAWLAGVRRLRECLRLTESAEPLIWLGIGLLLCSGLFLHPDLGNPLVWLKLTAIVLLVNNGLVVDALDRQLRALPPRASFAGLPRRHRYRLVGTIAVSQTCWWLATVIGLVVTTGRRS